MPSKEHHQLQLKEDDWVNTGASTGSITIVDKLTDKGYIEYTVQLAIKVVVEDMLMPLLVSEPNQGVWVTRPARLIVGVDRVSAMLHRASGWPSSSQETASGPPGMRGRAPTSTQVNVPGASR
jgi:hypothetical protein